MRQYGLLRAVEATVSEETEIIDGTKEGEVAVHVPFEGGEGAEARIEPDVYLVGLGGILG
jgi:hypothetical protein